MVEDEVDPVKSLYRQLIRSKNPEVSGKFKKYGYNQFKEKLTTDQEAKDDLANYLVDKGEVKSQEDFYGMVDMRVPKATVSEPEEPTTKVLLPVPRVQPVGALPNKPDPNRNPYFDAPTTPENDARDIMKSMRREEDEFGEPKYVEPEITYPNSLFYKLGSAVKSFFKDKPKPQALVQPKQWENQAEIEQSAKSPLFKDQKVAQAVLADQDKIKEDNTLTWRQDEKTGKFRVFETKDFDDERPLATFDTKEDAQIAIDTRQAAPSTARSASLDFLVSPLSLCFWPGGCSLVGGPTTPS